jgi:hypothetical protein
MKQLIKQFLDCAVKLAKRKALRAAIKYLGKEFIRKWKFGS